MRNKTIGHALLVPFTIMTVAGSISVAMMYLSLAPFGSSAFAWFTPFVLLGSWIIALVGYGVAATGLTGRSRTLAWILIPAVFAGVTASLFVSARLGSRARMTNLSRVIRNAEPLILAIRKYESDKGRPPDNLQSLVPKYLPQIPETGLGSDQDFDYRLNDDDTSEPWTLDISTPSGGINFDQFRYHPSGNYPNRGWGGTLERIGDWAYVHE